MAIILSPLKRVVTLLLLLVMLTQTFSKVLITLHYEANKAYIAAVLCINKSKPELHCKGHCYLKKQIKKAEQAEQQTSGRNQKKLLDITLYCQALFSLMAAQPGRDPVDYPGLVSGAAASRHAALFHPPRFAV